MNIVILTSSYPRFPGDGTAPFIQSIAENLAKLGHKVEVVAPYDPEVTAPPTPRSRGEQMGYGGSGESSRIMVHRFGYIWPRRWHIMGHAKSLRADVSLQPQVYLLLPFFLLAALIKLLYVSRGHETQLIHVNWVLPNGPVAAAVSAILGIPFVVSLHGSDMYVAQSKPIFSLVARWIFRRADAVTACSRELLHAAKRLGAPEESHLLAWGADPEKFHPKPPQPPNSGGNHASAGLQTELRVTRSGDRAKLDKKKSHSEDEIRIISLGRFVHKKGFDTLVRAYAKLTPHYPNTRLIIAGEGPLRADLEELASTLSLQDRIAFPGRIPWDQVADFLSRGDIFVLPSVKDEYGNLDGLPTVLLEAMACGLAVVASDIGGISLVIKDAESGLLVPPGDPKSLATTLKRLLEAPNERRRQGLAARMAIVNEHNWEAVARKLTEIFEASLGLKSK